MLAWLEQKFLIGSPNLQMPEAKAPGHIIYMEVEPGQGCLALSLEKFEEATQIQYLPRLAYWNAYTHRLALRHCTQVKKLQWLTPRDRWMGMFYGPDITASHIAPLEIRYIDPEMGYGAFAREDIPMHTLIGEYTGVIRKCPSAVANDLPYAFTYPRVEDARHHLVIEAGHWGNEMRYLNHSETPNCTPRAAWLHNSLCIVLSSTRTIYAGEELTYDYGEGYWHSRKRREGV